MAAVDEATTPPVDDDNNPALLQDRVKKLTKKLKNERKAKEDLESRYKHLYEALQSMMVSLNNAHAVIAPQAAKKIDNTTDNKGFVDKSVAQKDVDSWMNIFAKKGSGPASAPSGSTSNPNLPTANSGPNLDRSSNNSSPAPRDRKSSAADLTVQPTAPVAASPSPAASPVVKKVQKQQGIDNTTDNKQFVDKNHAEKDIDSWMKIFKK
eukprot:TRINITY_DN3365_c0_g1_i1.p1 TRINITY_DN3365_c0_g1~~TRINITY_DN3365_c0_g1_i1.p1  ORF type:complete len:209 (+),score=74.27 TRINITY_DN3365_c0_g1_i1:81-707(+)